MTNGLIYIGSVVEITEEGPLVLIPQFAPRVPFGPLPTLVADLAVDERVAVSNIGQTQNAYIVLGRMSPRAPTQEEIPGLDPRLDAIEAKDVQLDGRLTGVEGVNGTQNTRLTAVEGANTTQDGRLTAVEGRATTVEGRATAVEGRATTLEGRATAIEGVNTTQNTNIATNGTAITTLRADTAGKVTTKGDLLLGTGAGVLARQAVGVNGQALVADSAQANGVTYTDIRGLPVGGTGLTGVANPTRYVGATGAGKPASGTFVVGDYAIDRVTGDVWVCTVAGSPGTWISRSGALPLGFIARARRVANYSPLAAAEQVRFTVNGMSLPGGRCYRFRVNCPGGFFSSLGAGFGLFRLRYTTNNTVAGLASPQLTQALVWIGNNQQTFTIAAEGIHEPATDQIVSVALTSQCAQTDYALYAGTDYPLDFTVEDMGLAKGFAAL